MKNLLIILALGMSLNLFAQGFVPKKVEGKVVDVLIGELDPWVGDYCVITVRDRSTGILYGLISEEGPRGPICDDADSIKKGWVVGAYRPHFNLLRDSDLIDALHEYSKLVIKNERVFFINYDQSLRFLDID